MSSDGNDKSSGGLAALVQELTAAAVNVEKDDLSLLAKMHGWCEAIVRLAGPEGAEPCPEARARAQALGGMLEQLVLGEADDPDAVLGLLRQVAAEAGGGAPPAEPAGRSTGGDVTSSTSPEADRDDVAERLAKVFDDAPAEPPGENSGPMVPGDDQGGEPAEPGYVQEPLALNAHEFEFVKGFVEEANEHIEAIESAVLEVERAPADAEKINDLFRPFHTIKGMAGFLNLRDVNCLTHEVETLLDQGRKGGRRITSGLIDLIFDVVDVLKAQVGSIGAYLADGGDGPVAQPPVADMTGYLRRVVAGRAEPDGRQPTAASGAQKVGENLVDQGSVAREVVDHALEKQQSGKTDKKIGEILVEDRAVTPRQVSQAIRPQAQAAAAAQGGPSPTGDVSIRIDTVKLDGLVDMVGELVIAQTLVNTNERIAGDPILAKDVGQVGKIIRDVQESAMAMRMVPIGATFQRMARLVRDVSRKADKKVELHISGEDTELDKNVIQQIGDPLVHMVRNAVDHGVEPPEVRRQAGKSEVGNVYLSAYHHAGNIVIEIRDDGKGLDREALIAKAVEKGTVNPGEELSDHQAFQLIFAPGFSMAEQVTDISGRGVGMDVVKRNIEQLRGRVEIASEKGQGSTFAIRLPLTLAIIDGMVVRCGPERFIIPTISIEQSLRPVPQQITTVQHKGEVLQVRGELVPIIQLGQLFGLTGRVNPCEAMVVIAQCDDRRIGIVVEELLGQQQVVIKSLGERFEALRGVSGAAILGDGRVGLILEMLALEALQNTRVITHDRGEGPAGAAKQDLEDTQESTSPPPEASAEEAPVEPELALT